MYIIVGLGNPENRYVGTRHNIGFDVIDRLASAQKIAVDTQKHKALIGKGVIGGQKVILAKPLTYMNLSGDSVRALADYYKVDTEKELIIVYDDVSLHTGQLRLRAKGSAGGHNGIKSIISQIGDRFLRIRVGVGEKPARMDLAGYVLGHFPQEEWQKVKDGVCDAASAVEVILADGFDAAMNRFNQKKEE